MTDRLKQATSIWRYFEKLLPEEIKVHVYPDLLHRRFVITIFYIHSENSLCRQGIVVSFNYWKHFINKQGYYYIKEIRDGYAEKINR